jgi:hypothetical protein
MMFSLQAREEGAQSQTRPLSISNLPPEKAPGFPPFNWLQPGDNHLSKSARAVARLPFHNRTDDEG